MGQGDKGTLTEPAPRQQSLKSRFINMILNKLSRNRRRRRGLEGSTILRLAQTAALLETQVNPA